MDGQPVEPPVSVDLPAHHPEVAAMEDGDHMLLHAHKAPQQPPEYPGGTKLSHTYHVTHMERVPKPKAKAGGKKAADYLKPSSTY